MNVKECNLCLLDNRGKQRYVRFLIIETTNAELGIVLNSCSSTNIPINFFDFVVLPNKLGSYINDKKEVIDYDFPPFIDKKSKSWLARGSDYGVFGEWNLSWSFLTCSVDASIYIPIITSKYKVESPSNNGRYLSSAIIKTETGYYYFFGGPTYMSCETIYGNGLGFTQNFNVLAKSGNRVPLTTTTVVAWNYLNDIGDEIKIPPYSGGGTSSTGGNKGDFDNSSDAIPIPSLPSTDLLSTGFVTAFKVSPVNLKDLSTYLWSELFSLETFKKMYANPMDVILGCHIVPWDVGNTVSHTLWVGNVPTDFSFKRIQGQFHRIIVGEIEVKEYWGSYLDYAPYTKIDIYLPYIGMRTLSADDCMGKKLTLEYICDNLTGGMTAFIKCGDAVLYTYSGTCSVQLPITGADQSRKVQSLITLVSSAIPMAMATGGGSIAPQLGALASGMSSAMATGGMKETVQRSGTLSDVTGYMGVKTAYLVITRPRQSVPENYNSYIGYPSNINKKLSDCKGFTLIQDIHLDGVHGTADEMTELENILKGGVII